MQRQQECFTPAGAPACSYQINYAYDALGRLGSRTVAGAGPETFAYDAIGRLISHSSDLGSFTRSYLGQTAQITNRQLAGSSLATSWSYLPNSGDRRLSGISNTGLSSGQFSTYQFTTTPENLVTGITETSDTPTAYPGALTQTASYNNLNQLTNLSGQALSYDADGNLLSDGQRNFTWDAENRLISITYPGTPGKQTAFTYDGLGRRVAITSTPSGGSATKTSYIWCGSRPCQARNGSGTPLRGYYAEGEFVPGSPGQALYYGLDQIGSVRRVFGSASSAPAFSYDPYGNALQATVPLTDFGYAGMLYNADSGLYLTQYRAYDPASGRWLSQDPQQATAANTNLGFAGMTRIDSGLPASIYASYDPYSAQRSRDDPSSTFSANLYIYVGGNPVGAFDPFGLQLVSPGELGETIGGIATIIGIGAGATYGAEIGAEVGATFGTFGGPAGFAAGAVFGGIAGGFVAYLGGFGIGYGVGILAQFANCL